MAARHERFALHNVTFAEAVLPDATMDRWDDATGHQQWLVRVITRARSTVHDGEFSGETADGRTLSGHVVVADQQVSPGGARETLIVFHGSSPLRSV